jgi:hypothetical protein
MALMPGAATLQGSRLGTLIVQAPTVLLRETRQSAVAAGESKRFESEVLVRRGPHAADLPGPNLPVEQTIG